MVNYIKNSDLKQYLEQIKSLLPIYGKQEKKFADDLEANIRDFVHDNPHSTLLEIYDRYGEPSEIVKEYYNNVDRKLLYKRLNTSKWVRRTIMIIVALLVLCNCFIWALLYDDMVKGREAYENRKIVIVEPDQNPN